MAGIRLPYHLNNRKFLLGGGALTDKQDDIATYFFLDKQIAETYKRIRHYETMFNSSNFYTCIQERYEDVTTVAFNIEREVVNYVTAVQQAERHIRIMAYKHRHFNRFMQALPSGEREYLISRYKHNEEVLNERLDRLLTDEVAEIEEAVRYRFDKVKPAPYIGLNPLEETNFEDSFHEMLHILGV